MDTFLDPSFLIKWTALQPESLGRDFEKALAISEENLKQIESLDLEELNYLNTFGAFERATNSLERVWLRSSHLDLVCNSPKLREVYNAWLPKVAEFQTKMVLRESLWERLKTVARGELSTLSKVEKRYLEKTVLDFQEAGADLPNEKKQRLTVIDKELTKITQKFSENVLDSTNHWEWITDNPEDLIGLPESARESARMDALNKKMGTEEAPQWRFTLQAPSMEPVMRYAESRELRRRVWEASSRVGTEKERNNVPLIQQIVALRQEKAEILGKDCFADCVLSRRMAKTGQVAMDFTETLKKKTDPFFQKEIAALKCYREENTAGTVEAMEPWDVGFWAEKKRKDVCGFDEEELRSYFPIDGVISGMFKIAETLFSLRIKEKETHSEKNPSGTEVWHPEVRFYEVYEKDQPVHLGSFYTDWHPRESKRGGAWKSHFTTGGSQPDGTWKPHLAVICGNLTAPLPDRPALLTHREVETIFHEFGHLLHHLLGEVSIPSLNGTKVAWDFVELPSQIMENWCWERSSLDQFARHYQTGEPIPEVLLQKMKKTRNFHSGMAMMRQLSLGALDLKIHRDPQALIQSDDPQTFLQKAIAEYQIPFDRTVPTLAPRFTHIFGDPTGYAAGYYSYKWAEVLEADAFIRFQEEGILNPKTGMAFRESILSKGNAEPPETLFENFMNRAPDPDALLKRSGLA